MADPQTFDTGLTVPQRTIVRRAAVSALAPLTKAGGGYLASAKGVSCLVSGPGDEAGIAELMGVLDAGTPAIAVALGRGSFEPTGAGALRDHWAKTIELQIYVLSDNARGYLARIEQDAASLNDHTKDPGLDAILEQIEEHLIGMQPSDSSSRIHQVVPVDEDELWHDPDRVVWRQRYQVLVERDLAPHKNVTQHVTLIHTEHRTVDAETSDQGPLTVSSWNGTTQRLTFTVARPAGMAVGDRLVVKHVDGSLDPGKIIALVSTDTVTIDKPFVAAPVAGELVYTTTNPLVSETTIS